MAYPTCFLSAICMFLLVVEPCIAQTQPVECRLNEANLPFVTATIGDSNVNMLVDSGASHNLFCSTTVMLLNLTTGHAYYGSAINTLNNNPIQVGELQNQGDDPIIVTNLSKVTATCGSKVDGILGIPFLRNKTLVFKGNKIYIEESGIVQNDNEVSCVTRADEHGRIYLNLSVVVSGCENGDSILIDTGMNQPVSLCENTFEGLQTAGRIRLIHYSPKMIRFNGESFVSQQVQFGVLKKGPGTSPGGSRLVLAAQKNKVGVPWLKSRQVRVDFASGKVFVQNPEEIELPVNVREPIRYRR